MFFLATIILAASTTIYIWKIDVVVKEWNFASHEKSEKSIDVAGHKSDGLYA